MITLAIIIGLIFLLWLSFEYLFFAGWKAKEIKKDLDEVREHEKKFGEEIRKYIEGTWEEEFERELSNFFQHDNVADEIDKLMVKYVSKGKIKIKARKGAILIEKIYENKEKTDVSK